MKGVLLLVTVLLVDCCCAVSFFPTGLSSSSGSVSSQPLSVLAVRDQSGTQNTWAKYVEFDGTDTPYTGVFSFAVNVATASSFSLNVNYLGAKKSEQVWTFEWYIPSTNSYVFAGDNAAAADWSWSYFTFPGSVAFSSLVSSSNTVQLRLSSPVAHDNCDLDYVELAVTTGSSPTSPPATSSPTSPPTTSSPTSRPTTAPTLKPTSAPTLKPTSAPTLKPTSAPTSKPTAAPTASPSTAAPGGRLCPSGTHYRPGPYTTWQWQLSGTVDTSFDVQLYDIDMFGASTTLISQLHSQGRAVICYIDTAYEPGRPDSSQFTSAVLGNGIDGWPGQYWVDIRSSLVRSIMSNRIALAASKGCDGVEMDDVDSYENNPGFPVTGADQISFNTFLATTAHANGLGIALKNDVDQITSLVSYFDFAINEQCYQYNECGDYTNFINQGKAVLGVEYNLATTAFCPQANAARYSWLKKGIDLNANPRTQCCTTNCGGTYSCIAN